MIVFLVDGGNRAEFATRFALTFPQLQDRFKVMDYAGLAGVDELPFATFIFLDLRHSTPGRREMAEELGHLLEAGGAKVWGTFTEDRQRSERVEAPLVFRAETPDAIAESMRLETRVEAEDAYCDWILQGTAPEVIRAWPCPTKVDSDGNFRRFSFLRLSNCLMPLPTAIGRDWPIDPAAARWEPGPSEAPGELRENLGSPRIERIEYWLNQGQVQWWRIEDSAACLFRLPPLPEVTRQRVESEFLELDQNASNKDPIPISWRRRWLL